VEGIPFAEVVVDILVALEDSVGEHSLEVEDPVVEGIPLAEVVVDILVEVSTVVEGVTFVVAYQCQLQ